MVTQEGRDQYVGLNSNLRAEFRVAEQYFCRIVGLGYSSRGSLRPTRYISFQFQSPVEEIDRHKIRILGDELV